MPTTVSPGWTGWTTTAFAPTRAPSPTTMFPKILAPAPTITPLPTVGCRLPRARSRPERLLADTATPCDNANRTRPASCRPFGRHGAPAPSGRPDGDVPTPTASVTAHWPGAGPLTTCARRGQADLVGSAELE